MDKNAPSCVKILVIGDVATGKTSIIHRYVHKQFNEAHRPTLGVEFALKKLKVNEKQFHVQLWDIAGQERFIGLAKAYYKKAEAAVIVVDVTQKKTLENGAEWKKDVDDKIYLGNSNEAIPAILFANKWDLLEGRRDVDEHAIQEQLDQYSQQYKFAGWFDTSAKTGRNIKEGMKYLVSKIVENRARIESVNPQIHRGKVIVPGKTPMQTAPKDTGGNCC